jgi:hypothetical protein
LRSAPSEQGGGGALELEHAGQVAVAGDAAAEPAGEANARLVMPCRADRPMSWAACARTCCSVAGGRCGGSASGWLTLSVYRLPPILAWGEDAGRARGKMPR